MSETGCVIGSSFALRRRGQGEPPATGAGLLHEALAAGADGLVLCEGLHPQLLEELITAWKSRRDELPVLAVETGVGASLLGRPPLARAALSSLDRDEVKVAVDVCWQGLLLAAESGAPYLVLRLGAVQGVAWRWEGHRRRFLRGELFEDPELAERLLEERQALGARQLEACERGLEQVLARADRTGVTVLLRSPRRGLDLPSPLELRVLCEEFAGAPLMPLLDLPAAHLCSMMRLSPLRDTITAFGTGPLCYLADACGAVGGLPPGHGEVDVAAVARYLDPEVRRAYVPWPGLRPAEVQAGLAGVKALPRKEKPPPATPPA